ncbi:integrin alpha-PS2-like isoform X2 [Penaeus japonicus]|uniref:integrin alpha-PS2-like isoform X2 n=1 Tax=Penaeus japonicus TaxID=27405 RepID=UPI001C715C25|nr:integrin alpha-PS2-like isoform X2 [Penaeus japonicus]
MKSPTMASLTSWTVLLVAGCCSAFNIDIGNHMMYFSNQTDSMFGFAVAQHKYRGQNRLLVGAPRFETDQRQRGVSRAGAVLQCYPEVADRCDYVPFDRNGNNVHPLGQQLDSKSNQWFGATVRSSGDDGVVVACAPRYVWYTENLKKREPVGTCYVARQGLTDFQEFSPCRTRYWGYHRQGSCQAGFDAVISKDGERMFIGAPGAFYWQGQCWSTQLSGQIHSQSLSTRNDYQMTWEGPASDDDQYLGYSVAVGDFTGDGQEDVALGVPKGLNYTGKEQEPKKAPQGRQRARYWKYLGQRAPYSAEGSEKQRRPPQTWQEWFEQTGFLFQPKGQEGYSRTYVWNMTQASLKRPSYGTYSIGQGEFDGAPGEDVVVGVPRGPDSAGVLTGQIALYTHNLTPLHNISGYQLGAYFGYCLAVVDFNNDGLDDILVGSPMYTNYNDREMKYEVGRVHVLLQNVQHRFRQVVTYTGEVSKGRFGLSITGLGDVNKDGFQDIAVGAPYGGEDGNGAVFIYHGFRIRSGELIAEELKKPAQVIYARDVTPGPGPPIATFGWSLSGGQDMDNNLYPDLLVGAYLSSSAVLLRTRPVVSLFNHSLSFLSEGKTIDIESASLEEGGCLVSGQVMPCVMLQFCIGYAGPGVPSDLELDVEYLLDNKLSESRLFFFDSNRRVHSERVRLEKEIDDCRSHRVYVTPTLTDKLTPMSAEVNFSLVQEATRRRRYRRSLAPILNQRQKLSLSDSITIQKNCGRDNVCYPDLILTVNAPDTFVFGKKEQLEVDVRVVNDGEDAFEARVFIPIPQGLLYNKFVAKDNTTVVCSPRPVDSSIILVCEIGNPLPMHKGVHFVVLFQQSGLMEEPRFKFQVTTNSTNNEDSHTNADNTVRKTVQVDVDTKLSLYGTSDPERIDYNRSLYAYKSKLHEEHLGPQITHKYGISNTGPSDISETELVILWPTRTLGGNYLLYLLEQPYVTGPVRCSLVPDVNPLGLTLIDRELNLEVLKLQSQEETQEVSEGQSYSGSVATGEASAGGASAGGASSSGGSSYSTSQTTHYSSSSGGGSGGSGGSGSSSSSSSSSSSHSSSSSTRTSYSSSSSSYGYSSSSSSSSSDDEHTRRIRQAEPVLDWDKEINTCGPTECTKIHCTVGPLGDGDILYIYVRSRLVLDTLIEYPYDDVSITSRMLARVKSLPHGVNPEYLPIRDLDVTTHVSPAKSLDEAPPIPWWVIVLATMAGVLILLIIILVLWKCGYFKRHRPEHRARIADDAQPLNPPNGHNGHPYNPYSRPFYPGDEAL